MGSSEAEERNDQESEFMYKLKMELTADPEVIGSTVVSR